MVSYMDQSVRTVQKGTVMHNMDIVSVLDIAAVIRRAVQTAIRETYGTK